MPQKRFFRRARVIAATALATLSATAMAAHAQEPYYKGKRVTVIINYASGGPTDIEGRMLARHLVRHIEGGPQAIVQNMEGAGGLIGTNYLGDVAPKDGTAIGYLSAAAWQAANDPKRSRVDFRTYEFLAYQPGTSMYFMRADTAPGIKAPTDLAKAELIVSGGYSTDSARDLLLRLTLDMLGVKYKHVTGYGSAPATKLAIETKEINLTAETMSGYLANIAPSLVKNGVVLPIFYDSSWDGTNFYTPSTVEGLGAPAFQELYKDIQGVMPSGQLWEAYLTVRGLQGEMQRLVVLPPGTPAVAMDALRAAITRMNQDEAYRQETTKAFGYVPEYVATPGVNKFVRETLDMSPEMREFIAEYKKAYHK